jgi:hypothetical protein
LPTLVHLPEPAPLFGALLCLCAALRLRAMHAARGIPEEVTSTTLRDLHLWIVEHRRRTGTWGFSEMVWLWRHLSGTVVQLGRLQFELSTYHEDFHVFGPRRGGEITILAGDGMKLRADGQFADADGAAVQQGVRAARFVASPEGWEGERVDPGGFVTGSRVRLSREEWEPALERGDPVLGVHIPAGGDAPGSGPMTPEACEQSFAAARDYVSRHFPEHGARAFTCSSWLLDPQLCRYLPESTNIVRFQRRFHLLPVRGAGPGQHFERVVGFGAKAPANAAELDELAGRLDQGRRRPSAVERALVEHMRLGKVWREGAGVIPLANVGRR